LRNVSPVKNRTATPYELFTGRKPNLSFLRIWGCRAYVKLENKQVSALGPRSIPGIFVGYEPNSKAYRVLADGKIWISRNVIFLEKKRGFPAHDEVDSRSDIAQDTDSADDEVQPDDDLDEFVEMFVEPGDDYPELPNLSNSTNENGGEDEFCAGI